ncbi:SDR family NAD(P)-dependent oxidoreductase [Pontibacillus salicampi]|uniref:SDR family NAD(P)-dependent oxidoreductase n=1 Tax=Pontibacillus salicampi TaxID=1449801 RepID=A0ABV6LHY2_9BACI
MNMKYAGITGAGTGLGAELAKTYAKDGYYVYLIGRTEDRLMLVQREIEEKGGSAEVVICDITEPISVNESIEQLKQLDVFINNAGIGIFGPVTEMDSPDVTQILNTNIKGTIYMTQAVIPLVEKQGGRILNIISTAGLRGKVNESVYCASKFAQRGFTESLQKEYDDSKVSFTAVYMGGMNTPFWENSDHVSDPSRLKNPSIVAEEIKAQDDGRAEIHIEK